MSAIRAKLSPATVALGAVRGAGSRAADVAARPRDDATYLGEMTATIAEHDDAVLARYANDQVVGYDELTEQLADWTRRAKVHPIFFGSAITGAGVSQLMDGIVRMLPALDGAADDAASGVVFKIDRKPDGQRAAIVRMFSGTLRVREHVLVRGTPRRVTKIEVYERGSTAVQDRMVGGQIAKVTGLGQVRIGDAIGDPPTSRVSNFAPPPFEAVVTSVDDGDRGALRAALDALADEDPLINLRQDERRGELSVSLYGEVQRDVIRDSLQREFGIAVEFSDTSTVHIERLAGVGEASETMLKGRSTQAPFLARLGLRIEPAPPGTGVTFSPGIETGRLPMAFVNAVSETVVETVREGLSGWDIPDCAITMTASGYWPRQSHAHATFDKSMSSTASDFRLLTPLVLMTAIRAAGTTVHEPVHRFHLEAPADALGPIAHVLTTVRAIPEPPALNGASFTLRGLVPAARLHDLRQHLPGLTGGEGFVESTFDSYQPVRGPAPTRCRTDHNPLDRAYYLRQVTGRT